MVESQTLNDFIFDRCNKSMDNALSAERYPLWKRLCPELNDIDFITSWDITLYQLGGEWSPFFTDSRRDS